MEGTRPRINTETVVPWTFRPTANMTSAQLLQPFRNGMPRGWRGKGGLLRCRWCCGGQREALVVEAGCITAAAQRGHLDSLGSSGRAPGLLGELGNSTPSAASLPFAHITVLLFMRQPGAQLDVGQKLVSHPWGTGASSYLLLPIPTTNWGLDEADEGETASPLWHLILSSVHDLTASVKSTTICPTISTTWDATDLAKRPPTPTAERQFLFLSSLHQTSHREFAPSCADRRLSVLVLSVSVLSIGLWRDEFLPRQHLRPIALAPPTNALALLGKNAHWPTAHVIPNRPLASLLEKRLEQLEPGCALTDMERRISRLATRLTDHS